MPSIFHSLPGRALRVRVHFFCGALLLLMAGPTTADVGLLPMIGVTQLEAGYEHTCVLQGSTLKCWGSNESGVLGDGTVQQRRIPTDVISLGGIATAVSADGFSCAIIESGAIICWGYNFYGTLGDGTTIDRAAPGPVTGITSGATQIAAGNSHACALVAGTVKCWGENSLGAFGNGTVVSSTVPIEIPGLTGVEELGAGSGHTCARFSDESVKCWGNNGSYQLGNGTNVSSLVPVTVANLAGATKLAVGNQYACAIVTDGALKCWGSNATTHFVATDIPSLGSGVVDVAVGNGHTCAVTSGGAVRCFGANFFGHLGNGTFTESLTPTTVIGIESGALRVSLGQHHSCALMADGTVRCWGNNQKNQLGAEGTLGAHTSPLIIMERDDARRVATLTPEGNEASTHAVSDASGRYVVFQSQASNLVGLADSNASSDIFRVDLFTGSTERVSLDDNGQEISGDSLEPDVSANGEMIVFVAPAVAVGKLHGESVQKRMARTKGGGTLVLLRNMLTGRTQGIATGLPSSSGTRPVIAPDGRSIVITAPVSNPSEGEPGQSNVFRIGLEPDGLGGVTVGAPRCVSCKSVSAAGVESSEDSNGDSSNAVVSADGQFIAFESRSTNTLAGSPSPCPAGVAQVMLRNLLTGTLQRVSPPASLPAVNCGVSGSLKPRMDWAARRLVFESDQMLTSGTLGMQREVFLADLGPTPRLTRVSQQVNGASASGDSVDPTLSGDGKTIAFISSAPELDATFVENNGLAHVHSGLVGGPIARLSRGTRGGQADSPSKRPKLSYNGNKLVFDSQASNLTTADAGGFDDVFQRVVPVNADTIHNTGFE